MFDNVDSSNIQTETQNAPNLGFTTSSVLGFVGFTITAPQAKGTKVQPGFPQIPYVGEADAFFFAAMSNPQSAPYTNYGGSNTGQQVTSAQITQVDQNGTSRVQTGYQGSFA